MFASLERERDRCCVYSPLCFSECHYYVSRKEAVCRSGGGAGGLRAERVPGPVQPRTPKRAIEKPNLIQLRSSEARQSLREGEDILAHCWPRRPGEKPSLPKELGWLGHRHTGGLTAAGRRASELPRTPGHAVPASLLICRQSSHQTRREPQKAPCVHPLSWAGCHFRCSQQDDPVPRMLNLGTDTAEGLVNSGAVKRDLLGHPPGNLYQTKNKLGCVGGKKNRVA